MTELSKFRSRSKQVSVHSALSSFISSNAFLDEFKHEAINDAFLDVNLQKQMVLNEFMALIKRVESQSQSVGSDLVAQITSQLNFHSISTQQDDPTPHRLQILTINQLRYSQFDFLIFVRMLSSQYRASSKISKDSIYMPFTYVRNDTCSVGASIPTLLAPDVPPLHDNRRLLYSAMNKASQGIFFTYPRAYGGPSRLISEALNLKLNRNDIQYDKAVIDPSSGEHQVSEHGDLSLKLPSTKPKLLSIGLSEVMEFYSCSISFGYSMAGYPPPTSLDHRFSMACFKVKQCTCSPNPDHAPGTYDDMRHLWHEAMGLTSETDRSIDEDTYYNGMLYLETLHTNGMDIRMGDHGVALDVPFKYRWKELTIEGCFHQWIERSGSVQYHLLPSFSSQRQPKAMEMTAWLLALAYEQMYGVLPVKLVVESFHKQSLQSTSYTFDHNIQSIRDNVNAFLDSFVRQWKEGLYWQPHPKKRHNCLKCVRFPVCPLSHR